MGDLEVDEDLASVGLHRSQRDQQVLGGDVGITHLLGAVLRVGEHPGERAGDGRLADRRALGGRQLGDRALRRRVNHGRIRAHRLEQWRGGVAGHHQQRVQQVGRFGIGVARRQCIAQRGRDGVATLGGQFVGVHAWPSVAPSVT
jgi:hypothetical protein